MKCSLPLLRRRRKGSRPPRGGRGLKYGRMLRRFDRLMSPPSRGAWIEMVASRNDAARKRVAPLAGGVD